MTTFSLRAAATAFAAFAPIVLMSPAAHAQTAFAIANGGNTLISFDVATPSVLLSATLISGGNGNLDALAFRPSTGVLYGYNDNTNLLYTVDTTTAAITAVEGPGGTAAPYTGIAVDPRADRLHLVNNASQNIVFNPTSIVANTNLDYAVGDVNEGTNPGVFANAYTNNIASLATTTQYGIDANQGTLVTIANDGSGTLNTVGSLGTTTGIYDGLSIFTSLTGVNTAYALLDNSPTTPGGTAPTLYTVDLATGGATAIGGIGGGAVTQVYGLAVSSSVTVPEAGSMPLILATLTVVGSALAIGKTRTARRRTI